jgi:anti-sigma factor RsiW
MSEFFYRVRFRRDHRWAPGQMSAYLDGELASSPRMRMKRHTEECPECSRLLDGLRRMLGALHRLQPPAGGPGARQIVASVRVRLREPPPSDLNR